MQYIIKANINYDHRVPISCDLGNLTVGDVKRLGWEETGEYTFNHGYIRVGQDGENAPVFVCQGGKHKGELFYLQHYEAGKKHYCCKRIYLQKWIR